MSDLISTDHDELNLFDLFDTLWSEKWKIAIIVFFVSSVGVILNLNKDNVFQITVPLNNSKSEVFASYYNFNKFAEINSLNIKMSSGEIFDSVVREFNDYEEMIIILERDETIKEQGGLSNRGAL